ncbi:unnamed protein product [Phytophthora lilii]|uniref:Unnamed protein product n=1 Tax=Phytophthora lilii TaxID=2077276 RepID=A0A9W6X8G4_9STRA|nr:unnamed protein product [Phytophthora lilii]
MTVPGDSKSPPAVSRLALWAAEGVAHCILCCLDLSTLDALLHSLRETPEFRGCLEDGTLWTKLSTVHFGGRRDPQLQSWVAPPRGQNEGWDNEERPCVELQEFGQSLNDRKHFDRTVTIVEDDIRHIESIDGESLDGIVFPTNPYLTNHYLGAAEAVYQRAGSELDGFVEDPSFRGIRPVGSAVVTPGFDAGVDKLIHCVGPNISMLHCYELLGITYENALATVLYEHLVCVAMVSISTGSLGASPTKGAKVAMREIQKFLVRSSWQGKIAIVCKEEHVLEGFKKGKSAVLENFNVL